MEFTWKEIAIAIIGSGGFIGGILSVMTFVSARFDARKLGIKESIHDSAEIRRLEIEATGAVEKSLWRIINSKEEEIKALREEIEELERTATLTRPVISKLATIIREMRKEIESLKIIMLSDDETKYFGERWMALKAGLDKLEEMLP